MTAKHSDPVDGLDQRAWAEAGFTVTEMNRWGDHFEHPREAVWFMRAGVHPVDAARWHAEFLGMYPTLSIAGIRAGWSPEPASAVFYAACESAAWAAHRAQGKVKEFLTVTEQVAAALADLGLSEIDAVACLDAGLTLDEIAARLSDGTLDLGAVHVLAALSGRDSGAL